MQAPWTPDGSTPSLKRRRQLTSDYTESTTAMLNPSYSIDHGEPPGKRPCTPSPSHLEPEEPPTVDKALLHLLDGKYIKRESVDAWNTSGAYCDVFKGHHPDFGKVAMKRPRMTGEGCTESQLRSFELEAKIWKALNHPNILQFVGMIVSPNLSQIWLVSIFAENGTLPKYIREYPGVDRHRLVLQFTAGLSYLHSETVVHGDLKASNLLVSSHGDVLISDFGLSKLVGEGMTTTPSKKGAGSTPWMAPELLDPNVENSTKTFASDVYAYGLTVSEILRGEPPFNQYPNLAGVTLAILRHERPPKIPSWNSYASLWDVAEACWAPEPFKRLTMVAVCNRLSLRPPLSRGHDVAGGSMPSYQPTGGGATPVPIENIDPAMPPPGQSILSAASETRLLQLLGDADDGDVGHMKEDGLCLDGTRVEILGRLDAWAASDFSPRVTLLKGQAGRGKSTIARSVLSRYRKRAGDDRSSAIFHFRRGNETVNSRPLTALARQLGRTGSPRVRQAILRAVETHEDVAQLRLEEQFEILFVQPFINIQPPIPRTLVVVDALDECSDLSLISTLLRLIRKHSQSLPSSVKFLLSSRPEDHIIRPFNAFNGGSQEDLDRIDLALIDHDVRTYFLTHLLQIQADYGLDEAWMSPEAIHELVSLSQGLFQWAHAAMEYVRERPNLHLEQLVRSPNVILGLPALYRQILASAFPRQTSVKNDTFPALVQHVIGSLVVSHGSMSPALLAYLWDPPGPLSSVEPAAEIRDGVLGRLGSILNIPSTPDGPITFMHTSVRDFFTDKDQCTDGRFLIDPAAHHGRLAAECFYRMERDLKRDICGINDPSKMNSEVLDLVERHIPHGLRYCCRAWSTHLSEVEHRGEIDCSGLHGQLNKFCTEQLLYWLEVLGLGGTLSEVFDIVRRGKEWVEKTKGTRCQASTPTSLLLSDVNDFCSRFFHLISTHAQHLTISYLFHFPKDTTLWQVYAPLISHRVPGIIRGPTHQPSSWSRIILIGSEVTCIATSPDGKTLVSGSLNDTRCSFWDAETGNQKGPVLVGHSHGVTSIAFSVDGKTLASGSLDKTIRLWDVNTRIQKGKPLIGHLNEVTSVTFSSDGKTLASGSEDRTVRLWDLVSGKQKGPVLIGHKYGVTTVAFSPDGQIIASGSVDATIRQWNVNTGGPKGAVLVGHGAAVKSIAFSTDGRTLASGSYDNTIRLWDVDAGQQRGEALHGHTGWVSSIAFSADGRTLASGSWDEVICLWDVNTGQRKTEVLVGHYDAVRCVSFSSDGKTLASGSWDKTIRLWDVNNEGWKETTLASHDAYVSATAFSSDNKMLALGLSDRTIRLWDVQTEQQKGRVLSNHNFASDIASMSFSADGNTLAEGSRDGTVRLWDVISGQQNGLTLDGNQTSISSVAFSADSRTLASASLGSIVLWDVNTGIRKGNMDFVGGGDGSCIALSPNGKMLALGRSLDESISLWDVYTGKYKWWYPGSRGPGVTAVAFSPDGLTLASGSTDKIIRLWDVDTGRQKCAAFAGGEIPVRSITFATDGNAVFWQSLHTTIGWNIESRQLNRTALRAGSVK